MRILALNCGSSSVKSALIDASNEQRLCDVRVENLGSTACRLRVDDAVRNLAASTDSATAVDLVLAEYRSRTAGAPIDAVAHRIVHGGEKFTQPTVIDDDVLEAIGRIGLAPLHNPPALAAIARARAAFPQALHVALFDTMYHTTLPGPAREYALPRETCQRLGLRRFGFHGISHAHVVNRVAECLHTRPQALRVISCHLGNGASMTAIEHGRSVETSMGMTPLEGLVMGTRAGDVDPGVLLRLLQSGEVDPAGLEALLNTRCGLVGLTGTNDMQEIERRAAAGDEDSRRAIELYTHRIRKYIGAYAAVMAGVDVIAFTGGVGEHSAVVRRRCALRLDFLGAELDEDRNRTACVTGAPVAEISAERSRVRLLVVRSDEELAMAREVAISFARGEVQHASRVRT